MEISKLLTTAFLSITLSSTAFAGKNDLPNGKPFVQLAGQIIEVEGEISDLQDQIDSLVSQVDAIEDRVGANEDAIVSLEQKNIELQATLDAYGSDIASLNFEIDTLQSETADLQAQLEAGDASLQSQIDDNNALITSLQLAVSDLSSLEAQIANNTALIGALEDEIESINTLLATKQDIVDGNCAPGFSIRQINEDGSVVCEFDDTASGTSGSLISQVYVSTCAYMFPYGTSTGRLYCPVGYVASGMGYYDQGRSRVVNMYASGNFGYLRMRSEVPYMSYFCPRLTCIKIR